MVAERILDAKKGKSYSKKRVNFTLSHYKRATAQPPLTPPYQGSEQSFPLIQGGLRGVKGVPNMTADNVTK
jgi:hypothetical protein